MPDTKGPAGGPKTADSKRDAPVGDEQQTAGADQYLDDTRGRVFGDNTSSTGGANNPGQHGRDGGEIGGTEPTKTTNNNPAPSEDAQEPALAEQRRQEQEEKESGENTGPKTL